MARKVIKLAILTMIGAFILGSNASAVGESASLSSSGVNFEITPTLANPNGTVAIGTDNLTVSSTCSSGYKLYISTTSNDENESSLVNADNAEYSIPAVSGTIASPTLLNSSASKNHWGFAMTSSETGIANTGFSESTNTTVTNTSLFSSIPTLDNMTTIRQKTSSADNETVNVYYGVNAGTDLTPGSYSSTVMYTMVMPSPCDYTLMFEDGVSDSDPIESEVTKMPESTNIGRNTEVNLGDYINEFSREGYSITGWKNLTDDLTYTKDQIANINATNADIIKLAPIWTLNTYTVSLSSGTGITSTTITVVKDTSSVTDKTGTTVTDSSPSVTVGYGSNLQISYAITAGYITAGYHFTEWEITSVDTDADGNPLLTEDDLTLESGLDSGNNSVYSFTLPASSVALTAKAEGNKYTVHFDANGGTGEMADVEMIYGSPSTLPANTFTYGDYDFYGWSKTQQDPSLDPTRDYTDGQTGVFNLTTSNPSGTGESTLYAVWKTSLVYDDIMQNWTGCTSLTISTTENYENSNTYADLLDTRNNVVYRVRRYNDDACWMTENLRLTPGSSDPGSSTVDSGTITTTAADSEAAGSIAFTSSFSTSTSSFVSQGIYKGNTTYGAYYSWEAAKLVCPAGWTLPTNTQYSNFLSKESITDSSAGSTKIRSVPYSFSYAGGYYDSSLSFDGSDGHYWASTQYNNSLAYTILFSSSRTYVSPDGRRYGFSARCVQANNATMQSFTAAQCAKLTASTIDNYEDKSTYRVLKDARNAVFYTVRKYADNMCWMAENLAITPGTAPPTGRVNSGTLTTTTSDSEASGSVSFTSNFSISSYTESQGVYLSSRYGAYYSWTAAKLICPAGWALPTNTQYSSFLNKEYIENSSAGSTKIRSMPYNFSYTGGYGGGTDGSWFSHYDDLGYYWSSTQSIDIYGIVLYLESSTVTVAGTAKYSGHPVRCLHV